MTLSPGTKLGSFEISGLLGVGGMGEVYRARDTKLGREVAIKVLPEVFAKDKDRLARFEREAKLLAALNHPNIAGIHDLGHEDGTHFLVMELVEGQGLDERLGAGVMSLEEALPLFAQIAEALDNAHDQGIIHRDLKPANIRITEEGKVKVLDFGLAKVFQSDPSGDSGGTLALGSANQGVTTAEGKVMGTPAYMSPEQARGQKVDKRADIWGFGCCLYEALAAKRPFRGDTASDLLADILKTEPDWEALPKETPARVRDLLWRCLQKDPRRRLRDIGDAWFEISESPSNSSGAFDRPGPTAARSGRPSWAAALSIALVAAAIGALVMFAAGKRTGDPAADAIAPPGSAEPDRPWKSVIQLPSGVEFKASSLLFGVLALSPDGTELVYTARVDGERRLYLQPLDETDPVPIPGSEDALGPFFSPDGQEVGYRTDSGAIWKIPVRGGKAVRLFEAPEGTRLGEFWSEDGRILFNPSLTDGIWSVRATGGAPEPLVELDRQNGEFVQFFPQSLPGGEAVLFAGVTTGGVSTIFVAWPERGERKVIVENSAFAKYIPTGHLIFTPTVSGQGGLLAAAFDLDRMEITGPHIPILPDAHINQAGLAHISIADDGKLAYLEAISPLTRLVWVDREGNEEPLDAPARIHSLPRVSPDGSRVLTRISEGSRIDLWTYDLARGRSDLLTSLDAAITGFEWSSDGDRVYFSASGAAGETGFAIATTPANVSGESHEVVRSDNPIWLESISADGALLAWTEVDPETGLDVRIMALGADPTPQPIAEREWNEAGPALSPDGRWIAYSSNRTGTVEIYVADLAGSMRPMRVSGAGGNEPLWVKSGQELFFRGPEGLMAVSFDPEADDPLGDPVRLFADDYVRGDAATPRQYDVSSGGERFLMLKSVEGGDGHPRIVVVQNWFEELKRLVPVER